MGATAVFTEIQEGTGAQIIYSSGLDDFSVLPCLGEEIELDECRDFHILKRGYKNESKIEKISQYRGLKLYQKISVKYRDLKSKINLKPSELVLLGVEKKLKAFNEKFFSGGLNFADELITFRVVFILKDGGKTKVFLQVE